jgi:hypothetical protein
MTDVENAKKKVEDIATIDSDATNAQITLEQWLAIRKEAGLKIDPETAEVYWEWGQILDPYGVPDLSEEEQQIGRLYFARSPGSDIWVSFYDLPDDVREAFWQKVHPVRVFGDDLSLD